MSVDNCHEFLKELINKIRPIAENDIQVQSKVLNVPISKLLAFHNRQYYNNQYLKKVNDVDISEENYNVDDVLRIITDIYADLLDINKISVGRGTVLNGDTLVVPYLQVNDKRDYLDLKNREGKYPHPSNWNYHHSKQHNAYLTCCFGEQLSHKNLVLLFHEL